MWVQTHVDAADGTWAPLHTHQPPLPPPSEDGTWVDGDDGASESAWLSEALFPSCRQAALCRRESDTFSGLRLVVWCSLGTLEVVSGHAQAVALTQLPRT